MQKIFIVTSNVNNDHLKEKFQDLAGHFSLVNKFIKDSGTIVSVTPQNVSADEDSGNLRGRWLVVADDGKGIQL